MIYLDNAASTWPKPPEVAEAVANWIRTNGANPGRGTHKMARDAQELLYSTRVELAAMFGVKNPAQIVLLQSVTEALNLALFGILKPGEHVVATGLEHNSIRRPLERLKTKGVKVSYIDYNPQTWVNDVLSNCRPETRLVAATHGSNVTGDIFPVGDLGQALKLHTRNTRKPYLLVDVAQTAGVLPIEAPNLGIDILAFTGHKALMGPQGTGGLYVSPEVELRPMILGGTGGDSLSSEGPKNAPDCFEAGTRNTPGIAGLREGLRVVRAIGVDEIHTHEAHLNSILMDGLTAVEGVKILGPRLRTPRLPLVSFTLDGYHPNEVALILDEHYDIAVRAGLHCAPNAHKKDGTIAEQGAVRASVGYYNTLSDIQMFLSALHDLT